jgi:hypothetical protein
MATDTFFTDSLPGAGDLTEYFQSRSQKGSGSVGSRVMIDAWRFKMRQEAQASKQNRESGFSFNFWNLYLSRPLKRNFVVRVLLHSYSYFIPRIRALDHDRGIAPEHPS